MRISRRIWGGAVLALGLIWVIGGGIGYFHNNPSMLIMILCGLVLTRMGVNFLRGDKSG